MPAKENIQTRWSDRSRIFGLPITFTKYSMSDDRIFCEKGLLNMKFEEILLYRVRDISMKITLGQRIFGVGSILLQSSDKTAPVQTGQGDDPPAGRTGQGAAADAFWRGIGGPHRRHAGLFGVEKSVCLFTKRQTLLFYPLSIKV